MHLRWLPAAVRRLRRQPFAVYAMKNSTSAVLRDGTIAPAVKDGALQVNGEAIALIPENAREISAAVAELRQAVRQSLRDLRMTDRIAELNKRCTEII
jgi:hypothetical protein